MLDYRNVGWWYWVGMVGLLGLGLSGWEPGFTGAHTLGFIQVLHFLRQESNFLAFSVQVRFAYLGILLLGLVESFHWLYWLPFIGTTVRVLSGYCLLASTLSLMPWNRKVPLSRSLIARTFFSLRMKVTCADRHFTFPKTAFQA